MPRFEMLGGRHDGGDGKIKVFHEGRRTIVESDLDLDEMFKNSFRRLDDPKKTKINRDHRNTADLSGTKVMDDLLQKGQKTKKQRADLDDIQHQRAKRPNKIALAEEQEKLRGVDRDDLDDDKEEDEDLDELDDETEETNEEETSEPEEEEEEDEDTEEVEEEKPKPAPVKVKKKMKDSGSVSISGKKFKKHKKH